MLEGYAYSAYGETAFYGSNANPISNSQIGNRFLYQGQLYDPALRAYHMRAREYRPNIGRFLSPDPIDVLGGENLYAFVLGKPLAFSDPFGMTPIENAFRPSVGQWTQMLFMTGKFHPRWTPKTGQ